MKASWALRIFPVSLLMNLYVAKNLKKIVMKALVICHQPV